MTYVYKCVDENCKMYDIEVEINKKMSESSRDEFCDICSRKLDKVWKPSGIRTSDGFKS